MKKNNADVLDLEITKNSKHKNQITIKYYLI